jgi:hypothetical protein
MPLYEGYISCIKEDGRAEVLIEPGETGVPGASPQVSRRVCHCATDSSTVKVDALNVPGAGVGDQVLVSLATSGLVKNAAVLLGIPWICLMLGIAIAAILFYIFMSPMIVGILVAACFFLSGIAIGVRMYRRLSDKNPPVIDCIIKTHFDAASICEDKTFPMQCDNRGCDGCGGDFS